MVSGVGMDTENQFLFESWLSEGNNSFTFPAFRLFSIKIRDHGLSENKKEIGITSPFHSF